MNGMESVAMTEQITLGGGCFWCLEAVYLQVKGVEQVVSGYAGGRGRNPSYQQVCTGTTGHAEVVQVTFDTAVITLREVLEIFFTIHDPTTLNRQGNDVGIQYRSVVFYHSAAQRATTEQVIAALTAVHLWPDPIITQILPLTEFYRAEEYHQNYYQQNPYQPYCQFVVAPKVAKFRQHFLQKARK